MLMERFAGERQIFQTLMADRGELDNQLAIGAEKARKVAIKTINRVREKGGYGRLD